MSSDEANDSGLRGTQGWLHCILYVLFENAMGIVKLWACVAGACSHPRQPCLRPTCACQASTQGLSSIRRLHDVAGSKP